MNRIKSFSLFSTISLLMGACHTAETWRAERGAAVAGRVIDVPSPAPDGSLRFHVLPDRPSSAGAAPLSEMETSSVIFEDAFEGERKPQWQDAAGSSRVEGGKLVTSSDPSEAVVSGLVEGNARASVEGDAAAQMGILLRFRDPKNFVLAFYSPGAKTAGFHEVIDGRFGPWIQPVAIGNLKGKTVRMAAEIRGQHVEAVWTDEEGHSQRSSATLTQSKAPGTVGLYRDNSCGPTPQRFDNFQALRLEHRLPEDAVEVILPASANDEKDGNAVWAISDRVRIAGQEGQAGEGKGARRSITAARVEDIIPAAEGPGGGRLFPSHLPGKRWLRFHAEGFSDQPACGVIYRTGDPVTNGMPLGGVDTGCLDLETNGLLGYLTIFNTHVPRRGPVNAPILGLSAGGKTWLLCAPQPRDGWGEYQPSASGRPFRLWRESKYEQTGEALTPAPMDLKIEKVETAREIHYWGHYPIADLEFDTTAPVSVGLRAWAPFFPGEVEDSLLPGAVFEAHLRNDTAKTQSGSIAFSFPGPLDKEAGATEFKRQALTGSWSGVEVTAPLASYSLGIIGVDKVRTGGELGGDCAAWSKIHERLPDAGAAHAGASAAVDFSLSPGEAKTVRFLLTWSAPDWNAGGYNWAGAPHSFTHMYAKHYPSARQAADLLAQNHQSMLRRICAWQKALYTASGIPVWLRDSLVNVLHLITETGMWAQKKPPLPAWVREEDGLFGMNECPRGCPQIECIPCSFYGNQPVVYFFPRLALSTLRGYKGYQYPDGAAVWIFGGCTGGTAPIDFANPTRGYQFATNGISLAAMVDRYHLCHGDREKDFVKEFFPTVQQNMIYTVNLRPEYPLGDRIISMPTGNVGTEWFEAPEPGWRGMTAHVGGLHLAQLRIAERMARLAGDAEFAEQCAEWIKAGAKSMEEKLWTGSYYLNYLEPETNSRSDLIFGYQLDGEWITDHHGLASPLPEDRVKTVMATIKKGNIAVTRYGAVNYVSPDGKPAKVGGYGTYSYFPPEALMLAMTYMYNGEMEFGLELARRVWHNIVCIQGYTWDMPNIMRGDVDTGERTYGNDYYQDLMLWSMPAAVEGKDFGAPARPGGLVDRVIQAARRS